MLVPDQPDIELHMPDLEKFASESRYVLELGTGHGNGSSRAFTRGIKQSTKSNKLYISVDYDREKMTEKPDLDYWYMIYGDSRKQETLDQVLEISTESPDIIFIDTEHSFEQMTIELNLWSKIASKNTMWLFHDTWMFGFYNPMTDAIKNFCIEHPEWKFIDYKQNCHGLGMMRWK